jgi:FtsZ-binding cell division protein ZapB
MLKEDATVWGTVSAAILAGFVYFRHFMRRDKEDISASSLNVAVTEAAKSVIGMLERQVQTLIEQVKALRLQVDELLHQKHECETQNQLLLGQVANLNQRVKHVEKVTQDSKS